MYYLLFIVLGGFLVLNMFVGVVVDTFQALGSLGTGGHRAGTARGVVAGGHMVGWWAQGGTGRTRGYRDGTGGAKGGTGQAQAGG